jgi:hypothetical protein
MKSHLKTLFIFLFIIAGLGLINSLYFEYIINRDNVNSYVVFLSSFLIYFINLTSTLLGIKYLIKYFNL